MHDSSDLVKGLAGAMARAGYNAPTGIARLTGGATMESWRFSADGPGGTDAFVLRRAPSLEFMRERPFGHDVEAAVIRVAHAAGVRAPEVVVELEPDDGIGSGFVMRALPGTPDPKRILEMEHADQLLCEAARDLAKIHALDRTALPDTVPDLDYADALGNLRTQFDEAGGNRPIIALGLKWLADNMPERAHAVLNHGDYRLGNLLAADSRLTGVLDWELAHFGDRHEDLAFGCMAVWRFARYDRPALGLGSLGEYFAAYEEAGGDTVDPARFRYWLVYRTVWWALGCLRMAAVWRSGEDRMLERTVISRRTSEQELDLLLLLEEEAPQVEQRREVALSDDDVFDTDKGEASDGELAIAISEWLGTIRDRIEGHDRFQLAVARNALGIIARDMRAWPYPYTASGLSSDILAGKTDLSEEYLLRDLKARVLAKAMVDSPKYPALAVARKKWTGED